MKVDLIEELKGIVRENRFSHVTITFENGNKVYAESRAALFDIILVLEALNASEEVKFVIVKDKDLEEE